MPLNLSSHGLRYSHLNNTTYQHLFDSIANTYLALHCGHSPATSPTIGLVVHSHCDYFDSTSFPAVLNVGLRVNRLGRSSVVYEIAVFGRKENPGGARESGGVNWDDEVPAAVGEFVHVFVDRKTRRPLERGMEEGIKMGLGRLRVESESSSVRREAKM